jgi:hypothetical protein
VIRYGPFVAPIDLDRLKAAPLAPPPEVAPVDVRGYLPATAVVHKAGSMVVWHPYGDRCECFELMRDQLLDEDP